jgi:hypothetical protein
MKIFYFVAACYRLQMKYLSCLLLLCACAAPKLEPQTTPLHAIAPAPNPSASQGSAVIRPTSAPTRTGGYCATIEAVLKAEIYRGTPPKSQSQLQAEGTYKGTVYEEDDHFMRYLTCTYQVKIKGARYTFDRYVSGVTIQDALETSICESQREKVAQDIEGVTKSCADLRRGEFYGDILIPIK